MTRIATQSFAAFAAILLSVTSIATIVTVPPAQAQSVSPMTELA